MSRHVYMRDGAGRIFFTLTDTEESFGSIAGEFLPPGRWLAAPVCWGEAVPNTTAPTPGEAVAALAHELGIPPDQLVPHNESTTAALKGNA